MIFDLSYTVNDRISSRQTHLGADSFGAESKKKPSKTAEKAILTGASTGATMEIADALLAAESFEAEQCKHEEYYVIGMDGDEWNEGGENFAMLEIECESCGVRGKGETNLSYDTAPNREHNRIWWEDIGFEAETFNVEFDDWANQEMKSHGENVSFKKWAKEEGEKHGDVPLTDWAEHEEESHDERYGAENCEHFWDVARDGENYNRCLNCGITNERYEAENFESQSAQTKMKPSLKSISILLGLGAIAAVAAPENLKKMFKR